MPTHQMRSSARRRQLTTVLLVAGAATFAATAVTALAPSTVVARAPADSGIVLPRGYRDWRLISVAHEAGNLNDIRAILGNDAAIEAFRRGTRPLPDGAIVARVAWAHTPSAENNEAFGREQSFVAGAPTNVQIMVKNARKFAATGGWGFAQFSRGGHADSVVGTARFSCHAPAKSHDYLFTRYAP